MVKTLFMVLVLGGGVIAGSIFLMHRVRRYLRFLQQDDYSPQRFIRWIGQNRAVDKRGWPVAIIAALVALLAGPWWGILAAIVACAVFVALAKLEEDPTRSGRKPLVRTQRAVRIERVAYVAAILVWGILFLALSFAANALAALWIGFAICSVACPLFLVAAVRALSGYESRIQNTLTDEAKAKLKACDPFVIGITGSYGKTTTKHMLADLLSQSVGATFTTPGSVNTVMGITREIRERLDYVHRHAVIEMGAYREGSIARLCAFTPPRAGIITMVGIMHLERFGTPENIYRAKSELAQAIPQDGILVCNGDDPGARRIATEFPKQTTLLYGFHDEGDLACVVSDVRMSRKGMEFTIAWNGERFPCRTRMFGRNAVSNLAGAFTMACALGASPAYAAAALANIDPVDNRLSLTASSRMVFLNDAYNSNPTGFSDALSVLSQYPAQTKILVTPGMVELGEKQYEENRRIATLAVETCTLVILVGETNRAAWLEGLKAGGMDDSRIKLMADMPSALASLRDYADPKDPPVVLVENDLADVSESRVRF